MFRLLKIYSIFTLLCFLNNNIYSQNNLYFLKDSWQSSIINPAFSDTNRLLISLPSGGFKMYSPDFRINELLKTDEFGTLSLNEIAKNRIEDRNRITASANIQTLGVAIKLSPKMTLNFRHSIQALSRVDIEGKILKVAFNGLDDFVGNTYNFYSSINGFVYSSFAIGASYKLKKNIQIGGRIKYLNGISSFFTQNGDAHVTFENYSYGMALDNDIKATAYSLEKLKELKTLRGVMKNSFTGRNKGIAFDFGASFKLDKLQISLSAVDVFSKIYWKYGGIQYSSIGKYEYAGVNNSQLFVTEPSEPTLSITDSLKKSVGLIETPNTHFKQKFSPQIYLSGSFDITDKLQVGSLLYFTNELNGQGQSTLTFNTAYKISPKIQLGATAGFSNIQPLQYGMYFNVKFGKFQIIGATDNIISVFQPYNSHYSNGHLGINIAIK